MLKPAFARKWGVTHLGGKVKHRNSKGLGTYWKIVHVVRMCNARNSEHLHTVSCTNTEFVQLVSQVSGYLIKSWYYI